MRRHFISAVAALVASVAALAAFPQGAAAAGEIGPSAAAEVTCDSFTNQIHISALIGASSAYTSQTVGYQLYFYNATTRRWIDVLIDGSRWKVFTHQRVWYTDEFDPWSPTGTRKQAHVDYWAPTGTLTYTQPDGDYYIYARYSWLANGSWYDSNGARFGDSYSPWLMTRSYGWKYLGAGFTFCRL